MLNFLSFDSEVDSFYAACNQIMDPPQNRGEVEKIIQNDSMELICMQEPSLNQMANAIRIYGICVDLSKASIEKTDRACVLAKSLQMYIVVICQKIMESKWTKAASSFHLGGTAMHYESLRGEDGDLGQWKVENEIWEWLLPEKTLLIFDAAHHLEDKTTPNSKLLIAAKSQKIPMLILSTRLAEHTFLFEEIREIIKISDD